jgi:hypothetical protein
LEWTNGSEVTAAVITLMETVRTSEMSVYFEARHRKISEVFVTLMMEAVRTSERLAYSIETAWRYIPEGFCLPTRRRENLKSHMPYT